MLAWFRLLVAMGSVGAAPVAARSVRGIALASAALTVAVSALVTPALAEWKLSTAPDTTFGGERTILAGRTDRDGEVQALCNGDRRAFNVIVPAWMTSTWSDGQPVLFEVNNDQGAQISGQGTTFQNLDAGLAGVAFNDTDRLADIVGVLKGATELSWLDLTHSNGMPSTYYLDADGIVPAADEFLAKCSPGPAAAETLPGSWAVELGLGVRAVTLAGTAGEGVRIVTTCQPAKVGLSVVAPAGPDNPVHGTPGLALSILVDGVPVLNGTADIARVDPGFVTYGFAEEQALIVPLKAIAGGRVVEVVVGEREGLRWVLSTKGASEAVPEFIDLCGALY